MLGTARQRVERAISGALLLLASLYRRSSAPRVAELLPELKVKTFSNKYCSILISLLVLLVKELAL